MPQNKEMKTEAASKKPAGNVGYVVNIALRLLAVCAFVALLVAGVNAITKDKIEWNARENTAKALTNIYENDGFHFVVEQTGYGMTDADGKQVGMCRNVTPEQPLADITAVYAIQKDNNLFGYAVEVSPMGFKDNVHMLVAVNANFSVKAVQIISLSETKGIGDKVMQKDFLDKFINKRSGFSDDAATLSNLVIAGATRTSEPVAKAVDTALKQLNAMSEKLETESAEADVIEEESK